MMTTIISYSTKFPFHIADEDSFVEWNPVRTLTEEWP